MINRYNGVSFFCFGHLIGLACRKYEQAPWHVGGSTGKRELAIAPAVMDFVFRSFRRRGGQ